MRENWKYFRRERPTVEEIYLPEVAQALKDIYKPYAEAEDYDLFAKCQKFSKEVEEVGKFTVVDGKFKLDSLPTVNSITYDKLFPHTWCIDGKDRILDLTLRQFNPCLKNKVPEGILIIEKNDIFRKRYKPDKK